MDLTKTKTFENLEKAFGGESQARNKYTYFAEVAETEGYHQIAEIFRVTAENEKMHAKLWAAELGKIGGTADNLKQPQKVSIGNGQKCMKILQRQQKKRAFLSLPKSSEELQVQREAMKNGFWHF